MPREFTINFDPLSFVPYAGTTGALFVNHTVSNVPRPALGFDNATSQYAMSRAFEWPDEFGAGAVKAKIYFYAASAGASTNKEVVFKIAFESETPGSGGIDFYNGDQAHAFSGAAADNAFAATTVSATAGHIIMVEATMSNLDDAAKGDIVRFRLMRDITGDDDLAEQAFVSLVTLYQEA